jgi:hypothetical protein
LFFIDFILPSLLILCAIILLIHALRKERSALIIVALFLSVIGGSIYPQIRVVYDGFINRSANQNIKNSFPNDLDFFTHRIVRFGKGEYIEFNSKDIRTKINMSEIYHKGEKYYIHILYNIMDIKNNTHWIDQTAEVELTENNLVVGKTDRLDFYFYVAKTFLGNANVNIGIKEVTRGIILRNLRIKGNPKGGHRIIFK